MSFNKEKYYDYYDSMLGITKEQKDAQLAATQKKLEERERRFRADAEDPQVRSNFRNLEQAESQVDFQQRKTKKSGDVTSNILNSTPTQFTTDSTLPQFTPASYLSNKSKSSSSQQSGYHSYGSYQERQADAIRYLEGQHVINPVSISTRKPPKNEKISSLYREDGLVDMNKRYNFATTVSDSGKLDRDVAVRDSLINIVVDVEGGYSDRKSDLGGKTNKGISWKTWQDFAEPTLGVKPTEENLKLLTKEDAKKIYTENYWNKYRIDEINDTDLKHLIFDVFVNNTGSAAKIIQGVLSDDFKQDVEIDGVMGSKTINKINEMDSAAFYDKLLDARERHYHNLVKNNPSQKVNINGWIEKRVNAFRK